MTRRWLALLFFTIGTIGCAAGQPASYGPAGMPAAEGDAAIYDPVAPGDDVAGGDDAASSITVTSPPRDPPAMASDDAADDGGSDGVAADEDGPALDPPPDGSCAAPLAPGDLIIDELMIESVAGAGDYGEWLEVQSTLPCAVDLRGLHGECANGAKIRSVDVTSDIWIPAQGTFVIADSINRALDHDLPGTVLAWGGQPGDALRNKGATISLRMQDTLVDSVTYPVLVLSVGASVAFPPDCPATRRSDWSAWQTSTASWFPGFFGTPNAPNLDVVCP